jgi:hypothetical protein
VQNILVSPVVLLYVPLSPTVQNILVSPVALLCVPVLLTMKQALLSPVAARRPAARNVLTVIAFL